jgi:hypothetical protein
MSPNQYHVTAHLGVPPLLQSPVRWGFFCARKRYLEMAPVLTAEPTAFRGWKKLTYSRAAA